MVPWSAKHAHLFSPLPLPFLGSIGVRPQEGPSWAHLGPSWGHLGLSWAILGPTWRHLGSILGSRCPPTAKIFCNPDLGGRESKFHRDSPSWVTEGWGNRGVHHDRMLLKASLHFMNRTCLFGQPTLHESYLSVFRKILICVFCAILILDSFRRFMRIFFVF